MKKLISWAVIFQLIIPTAFAQTLNDSFEGTKPLTDKEQHEANTYFHQGTTDDYLKEMCSNNSNFNVTGSSGKKGFKDFGCDDDSAEPGRVFKGTAGMMIEEVLPKLYGLMGTLAATGAGGKIQMKPNTEKGAKVAKEGKEAKGEEKQDFCIFIPMAGEMVSSGMQRTNEKTIQTSMEQTGADRQREGMYAVARTHKSRSDTAYMQGGIYAATSACYVAYVASGAVVDWKMGLKIGAAAAMSSIFFIKAVRHKRYAENIRSVADDLPGAGECNPYTKTNCFCAHPSSQKSDPSNYQKVCVPPELAGRDPKLTPAPCAKLQNGKVSIDVQCSCKRNNSCLNGQLSSLGASMDFGGVNLADPIRMLNAMNGQFDSAQLENFAGQLNARSKNLLGKMNITDIPSTNVTGRNKEIAKELNKMGIPPRMAAAMANQSPAGGGGMGGGAGVPTMMADDAPASKFDASMKSQTGSYQNSNAGNMRRSNTNSGSPTASRTAQNNVHIESFAEQALAEAEITKDTSIGIFDLISNRYQRSAWSRFEMNKKLQEQAVPKKPLEVE